MSPRYNYNPSHAALEAQIGEYDVWLTPNFVALVWGPQLFQRRVMLHRDFLLNCHEYPGLQAWVQMGGLDGRDINI